MTCNQPVTQGRYNNVQDFVAAALQPLRNDNNKHVFKTCEEPDCGGDWFGGDCKNRTQVVERLRDGWPRGQKLVDDLAASIASSIKAIPIDRRRKRVRGDFGDELDIHAVYRGRNDIAWSRPVRQNARGPQMIEVVCNAQGHAGVPQEQFMWCGVASVVLVKKLEAVGYRVKLSRGFISDTNTEPRERADCLVVIKDYGRPLDIATCAACTMPGFFRAIGLSWEVSHTRHKIDMGVSRTVGIKEIPGKIVVPPSVRDRETAIRFINKQIDALNAGTLLQTD